MKLFGTGDPRHSTRNVLVTIYVLKIVKYTHSPGGKRVYSSLGQQQLDDILSRVHRGYMQHVVVILGIEEDRQIT